MQREETLLIKPIKWFFENINHFPHIFIASVLELFLIYIDEKQDFFKMLKDDFLKVRNIENLYILNITEELIRSLEKCMKDLKIQFIGVIIFGI